VDWSDAKSQDFVWSSLTEEETTMRRGNGHERVSVAPAMATAKQSN
jgi:hypothetical protein